MTESLFFDLGDNATEQDFIEFSNTLVGLKPIGVDGNHHEVGSNYVGDPRKLYRSDTNVAVNWHSEGYDSKESRIKYISLFCIENAASGGETLIANFDSLQEAEMLREARMRVTKINGFKSSWFNIFDGTRLRFSLPDDHKNIEYSDDQIDPNVIQKSLNKVKCEYLLSPGQMLLIDNDTMLHARNAYTGNRLLKRLVY